MFCLVRVLRVGKAGAKVKSFAFMANKICVKVAKYPIKVGEDRKFPVNSIRDLVNRMDEWSLQNYLPDVCSEADRCSGMI